MKFGVVKDYECVQFFMQNVLCVLCSQNISITASCGTMHCVEWELNSVEVHIAFVCKVASEDSGGTFLPDDSKPPAQSLLSECEKLKSSITKT
jgi:hypothetical protein